MLVLEKPGRTLKSELCNQVNPWPAGNCQRVRCLLCHGGDPAPNGQCWKGNVTYEIRCLACKKGGRESLYTGETARGAYSRSISHWSGLSSSDPNNVLFNHNREAHVGVKLGPRDFSMRVTGRFTSSLFRQVSEATQIADQVDKRNKEVREGREARTVMNSAREFRQPGIIRARHLKTFNY